MKSKSIVTEGPFKLGESMRYAQILAESYYTTTRAGVYKESTPNTSEILNLWYDPLGPALTMKGEYFYLGDWCTGLTLDIYTGPDGVTTERIIYKPTESTCNLQQAQEAFKTAFQELYCANQDT